MLRAKEMIKIYTDGGSRGNPGPAAAGFVLFDSDGAQLCGKGLMLGRSTNNVAEYMAVLKGLEAAMEAGGRDVTVFSDSELIVRQINGEYKVKSEILRPLFHQVVGQLGKFNSWKVQHIVREKNMQADGLVNKALDLRRDVELKKGNSRSEKVVEQKQATVKDGCGKAVRLGFLISGGGTTLMNILDYIKRGRLNAEIGVVISSLSKVSGVEKAKAAGLKVEVVRKKDYPDINDFSTRIEEVLVKADVELVVQGGWLCLWNIPQRYKNRVMNIHPALLPSFGGQGMWGHHVHEAVLKRGCKISGCTVHFCTNEYDQGPIIVQRSCPVLEGDSAETLAARVFEQECIAYPQAIQLFAEDKIVVQDGRIGIKS